MSTKKVGSRRDVYICDTLYEILQGYKELQNNYKNEYGKNINAIF